MNRIINFINHWLYIYNSLFLLIIYIIKKNFIKYTFVTAIVTIIYYVADVTL